MIERFGDGEEERLFERAADELDADGQAVIRKGGGKRKAGKAGEIEPLRMAHGFAEGRGGGGAPGAFAVAEGGSERDRGKKDGDIFHLAENLCAAEIALSAGVEKSVESDGRFRAGDLQIFEEHGAEGGVVCGEGRAEEMLDDRAEEIPPERDGLIEGGNLDRLDEEALGFEGAGGEMDGGGGFLGGLAERRGVEKADAQAAQFVWRNGAKRDGGGAGVAGIGAGESFEKQAEIADAAGHGANHANPGKRTGAGRKMAGGGDASGSGLESADTAEMGGDADGAAAVAADAAGAAAGGDGRGFAAAGAAGAAGEVPGIAGAAVQRIAGLIVHQEFGGVGAAENNGAGGFQAGDEDGVLLGDVVLAQSGARGAIPSGDVDAAFDGEGNAVQRTEGGVAGDGGFGGAGLGAGGGFIEMDEGVEAGVQGGGAAQMGFHDFDRRDFFGADEGGQFAGGRFYRILHLKNVRGGWGQRKGNRSYTY